MGVIVNFGSRKRAGMKGDRMDFSIISHNRKYSSQCVVGCIRFNDDLGIRNPVRKDWSSGKGFLEEVKGIPAVVSEVPLNRLPRETSKRNHDVGIVVDEATIEISETKEGLNVLNLLRFRPILNNLYLVLSHFETIRRENITKILNRVGVEFALVSARI